MAGPSPEAYMAMLLLALILPIILAITRYLINQKRSSISRSRSPMITDIFYYGALATQTTLCSILIYRTFIEIKLRDNLRHHNSTGEDPETIIFHKMTEPRMLLMLWLAGCCYYTVVCMVKGAFLAHFWGLYDRAGISFKWIKVTIVLTVGSAMLAFAFGIGWCRPISRNWSSDYDDYVKCSSVNSVAVRCMGTVTNIITDVAIILLPISLLTRLTLGIREKAALGFVYSIGFVSVIACLSSLVNLVRFFFKDPRSLHNVRLMEMWSVIEATSALFAFSLLAFKKFILHTIGSRPGGRVRPMRRVTEQQTNAGVGDLEYSGGANDTDPQSDPKLSQQAQGSTSSTSGDRNGNPTKAGRVKSMIAGWFGKSAGSTMGSSNSRTIGKNNLPSFVRGSLAGGTGWTAPKGFGGDSGGTGESSRNRRRRTVDDIELSSLDNYGENSEAAAAAEQKDRESKIGRGAVAGASNDVLIVEGPRITGVGEGTSCDVRTPGGESASWDERSGHGGEGASSNVSLRGTDGVGGYEPSRHAGHSCLDTDVANTKQTGPWSG